MTHDTSMHATPLLITGCYRSGTTVLEKVLNLHPDVAVASQPFPVLYALVKQRFLAEKGLTRRYPLGHLLLEAGYCEEELHAFLERYVLSEEDIADFFDQLDEYDLGLWTPEMREARGRVETGTFWGVYQQLMLYLEERFPRRNVKYRGTKEVLIEEFAPYFVRHGAFVIIVARDPRAMIASLNFRERDNLTGANRPILFSLRAWRKSVAIALALADSQHALLVRYEGITLKTAETLARISDALAVCSFTDEITEGEIVDQHGRPWLGNSSFESRKGIFRESVDTWRTKLPRQVVQYIETICLPEMRLLEYKPVCGGQFQVDVIRNFRDPFPEIHARFPRDYSSDPRRIEEEIERFRKLHEDLDPSEQRRWFLNEMAYHRLRGGMGLGK